VSRDDFLDDAGDEYSVVRMPDAWHVLSLLFFLAALGARFLTALIPREVSPMYWRPILTAFAIPVLAAIGVLFGLLGLRHPEGRRTARIALFLNGVVLVLGCLGIAALYWIRTR
jgi:hypothetical protein